MRAGANSSVRHPLRVAWYALLCTLPISALAQDRSASCTSQADAAASTGMPAMSGVHARISQLTWLVGTWHGPPGASAMQEHWTSAAGGVMLGTNRTTRDSVMTAFEFLCISERAGTLVFTPRPNAGPPTDFVLTHIDADSATFENPSHDFPRRIKYIRTGDNGMRATISGTPQQPVVTFAFARATP
jgi:hypothetical protein